MTKILATLVAFTLFPSCKNGADPVTASPNPGRELVMESIEAHGGAERWYKNGQLQFRWTYYQTDKGPDIILDTLQTVDTKSLAVKHTVPNSTTIFGFNSGKNWIKDNDGKFPVPPQFWNLLPYYFVGMPFVFNDDGCHFQLLPEKIIFENKNYTQVKITFAEGSGESPDDYYVLLIDPDTKILRGAYYTVTHPAVVGPNGPGPAKFISLDHLQDFSGIKLGTSNRTFRMKDGKIMEQMRHSKVSEIKFQTSGTLDLSIPEGAAIIE